MCVSFRVFSVERTGILQKRVFNSQLGTLAVEACHSRSSAASPPVSLGWPVACPVL